MAFTSASQASNVFAVAQYDGKEASLQQSLGRTLVASIGPVCSAALRKFAVRVDIESSEGVRMLEKDHMESEDTFDLKVYPFWAELRADPRGMTS